MNDQQGQAEPLGYRPNRLAGPSSTHMRGNLATGHRAKESRIVVFLKIVVGRGFVRETENRNPNLPPATASPQMGSFPHFEQARSEKRFRSHS